MVLIKIGGGAAINLEGIARDIGRLDGPVVVVHGANALRDELAGRLGVRKRVLTSVSGYSSVYSDAELIDVMLMAYSGLRNKRIVELLRRSGVNAIGLTGLDGALVRGRRNMGIRVREGGRKLIKRDLSGKPASVNRELLRMLIGAGYVPAITFPIADENDVAINSDNDDIVAALSEALKPAWVVQLIEAPGLLADPADPESVVGAVAADEAAEWERRVDGRMKRKMRAVRRIVEPGATRVAIADGRVERPVADALAGRGTVVG